MIQNRLFGKIFALILIFTIGLFYTPTLNAVENIVAGRLSVKSDLLSVYPSKKYSEFTGHVKAVYQERDLTCDRLRVIFTGKPQKLDRIEMTGNVKLVDKEIVGTCKRMIYYADEDKVILRGKPKLRFAENEFRGEVITFFLTSQRLLIEGGVEAELQPGDIKKQKK